MATSLRPVLPAPATGPAARPRAAGKFLFSGAEKLTVRGVTYGTFRAGADGSEFPEPAQVERDFAQMARHGINAVRAYTAPPRWLLDLAWEHGLYVLVGLAAEREVGYLNDRSKLPEIEQRVRDRVRACAGHPAVLCYAVGNEIPTATVRWLGRRKVERFLARLAAVARAADPGALITYVSYPSTEYLECRFADLLSFNVYLESRERFESYLPRLQNLAGDRPLLITELGLDSARNGVDAQAALIESQVRSTFAWGAAGAFVYAWTDEWHRGGEDVYDWDFGLVTRDRAPKPALAAVSRAFAELPFPDRAATPCISVVVCTYNGSRTLRDCLEGVAALDYPDVDAIVVDDGSTDSVPAIAAEFPVRLIRTSNRGLSAARNTGWQSARGTIVAYLDDDARPDPQWLRYLAHAYATTDHDAIGGPNIAPAGDGWIAEAVANAPGGPMHVLVSDTEAEHIPGCNMSFRRAALEAVGGFDPRYRTAGDDVDLCWRLMDQGGTIGFHPSAMVWHHRRNSVRTYWKQQMGYGRAEALLEQKWPERYNALGHYAWAGRIYGTGLTRAIALAQGRVYQGMWGSAPFQSLYQPNVNWIVSLPLMPEWFLVTGALAALSVLGLVWQPLLAAAPLFLLALLMPLLQALVSARHAAFPGTTVGDARLYGLSALLHVLQPLARLRGRLKHGLTPWRARGELRPALPVPRTFAVWTERWRSGEARLAAIDAGLRGAGVFVRYGGDYDRWDLEVRGGLMGSARLLLAIEEQGGGRQMVRARAWPRFATPPLVVSALFAALALAAWRDSATLPATILLALGVALAARAAWEAGRAMGALTGAVMRDLAQDRP